MGVLLTAAGLALVAALVWGTGDFFGGLAARRMPAARATLVAQLAALLLLTGLGLLRGQPFPGGGLLLRSVAAGVGAGLGMLCLYAALGSGAMAVAAPVAALLTTVFPAVASFFLDGPPGPLRLTGFAVAGVAIWLVAGGGAGGGPVRGALGLAVLAGAGFGTFQVLMRLAGPAAGESALAVARLASIPILVAASLRRGGSTGVVRQDVSVPPVRCAKTSWPGPGTLVLAALAGLFDAGGTALFLAAARAGRLDVASVLSALYPVSTVVLAGLLLRERPSRLQQVGLLLALAAVGLIA
jgi:drug/metabolite transporter (DMT)-like permease